MNKSKFISIPLLGSLWVEIMGRNETPSWPPPEGRRWLVERDHDGEVLLYLGPVFAIWAPRRKVHRPFPIGCFAPSSDKTAHRGPGGASDR